jgi:ABC-type branched-chain amino acid transport systems, periplasmic component
MIQRRKFIAGTGSATVAALAGCSGSSNASDESSGGDATADTVETTVGVDESETAGEAISVGVLLPFSGEYAWVGENVLPIVQMLAQEINEQGGIDNQNLKVVQGDTEGLPSASLSAAKKLITVENVAGIIGPTSITMSAVFDLFQTNQVPVVTPTAGTTSLDNRGGEYVFRTVPSDALGGRAIAKALRNKKYNNIASYSDISLMIGNKEVFQSFKSPIEQSFTEFGGTITETVDFKTGKASYESEMQSVMNANPAITVLVGSKDDSIKIMRAAFQAGYEGNWYLTQDQTTEVFLDEAPEEVTQNILGLQSATYQAAEEKGRINAFKQRVREFTGSEPKLFARNAYDAMNVLGLAMNATAVADTEITSTTVAENIRTVTDPSGTVVTNYTEGVSTLSTASEQDTLDYRGLIGPIDFDEHGDVDSPFAIMQSEDGDWVETSTISPSEL